MANIEFKTLEQFMPYWCQKILPAVYDDSLSYYQLLGRILQKYNEVIEIVNKHSETLVDHENRITAAEAQIELNRQAIEALKSELAKLDEQVKQNTANIAALTERVNGHDTAIKSLQDLIANIQKCLGMGVAMLVPTTHDLILNIRSSTSYFIPFSAWYTAMTTGGVSSFVIGSSAGAIGMIFMHYTGSGDSMTYPSFGFLIEDGDLHYFQATYSQSKTVSGLPGGATSNWTEVEVLDITNIKQSLGDGEYDTISQKVLTQLINSKLNHDMGITGATAGQYINIAEVDSDGKPVTYGFGTPGGGGSGPDVVQTTGQSTTSVMSQKATTDAINAVKTPAEAGSTAANMLAATVVYPTTASGTNGKFVGTDGTTLTRAQLLAALIGADGKNTVFTVKKTGATSWDRITWFKASAGEGLYDFAWYETDGTNAKAGVDRLTMATNGQFAVSEQSSTSFGQDAPGSLIAGEFEINKAPITLEYKTAPDVTNGINGGYLKDEIISGISTAKEGVERLLRYAFPVISGKSINANYAAPRLRMSGYSVEQTVQASAKVVFYAPWAGDDGGTYTPILRVECRVGVVDGAPFGNFTIKYYAPGI